MDVRKDLVDMWREEARECTQLGQLLDKLVERGGLPRIRPPKKGTRIGPYQWPAPYDKRNPERRVSYARVSVTASVWSTDEMVDFATFDSIPVAKWTTAQLFEAIRDLKRVKKWLRDRIAGLKRAEQEVLRQKRVDKWVDREVAARELSR